MLGEAEGLGDGETEADGLWLGLADGDAEADGDCEGLADGDTLGDGDGLTDGDTDGDRLGDAEGDGLGLTDGDTLGDALGDALGDGLGDALGLLDGEKDGERLGDSLTVIDSVRYTTTTSIPVEVASAVPTVLNVIPVFSSSATNDAPSARMTAPDAPARSNVLRVRAAWPNAAMTIALPLTVPLMSTLVQADADPP
jgi:hypothetical protein